MDPYANQFLQIWDDGSGSNIGSSAIFPSSFPITSRTIDETYPYWSNFEQLYQIGETMTTTNLLTNNVGVRHERSSLPRPLSSEVLNHSAKDVGEPLDNNDIWQIFNHVPEATKVLQNNQVESVVGVITSDNTDNPNDIEEWIEELIDPDMSFELQKFSFDMNTATTRQQLMKNTVLEYTTLPTAQRLALEHSPAICGENQPPIVSLAMGSTKNQAHIISSFEAMGTTKNDVGFVSSSEAILATTKNQVHIFSSYERLGTKENQVPFVSCFEAVGTTKDQAPIISFSLGNASNKALAVSSSETMDTEKNQVFGMSSSEAVGGEKNQVFGVSSSKVVGTTENQFHIFSSRATADTTRNQVPIVSCSSVMGIGKNQNPIISSYEAGGTVENQDLIVSSYVGTRENQAFILSSSHTLGTQENQAPIVSSSSENQVSVVSSSSEADDNPSKKRMCWTRELHGAFVDAVYKLGGIKRATPKGLLKLMNVEGLTVGHVKSHLQKCRDSINKSNSSEASSDTTLTSIENTKFPELQIGIEINETVKLQIELQKRLHELLEDQRKLNMQIEESQKYMKELLDKQCNTVSEMGMSSSSTLGIGRPYPNARPTTTVQRELNDQGNHAYCRNYCNFTDIMMQDQVRRDEVNEDEYSSGFQVSQPEKRLKMNM